MTKLEEKKFVEKLSDYKIHILNYLRSYHTIQLLKNKKEILQKDFTSQEDLYNNFFKRNGDIHSTSDYIDNVCNHFVDEGHLEFFKKINNIPSNINEYNI